MIRWGEKYKEWPDHKKIAYLESGWSSSNEALDKMQEERNDLLGKVSELEALLVNCEKAFQIQKAINHAAITAQNEQMQGDAREIAALKAKASE